MAKRGRPATPAEIKEIKARMEKDLRKANYGLEQLEERGMTGSPAYRNFLKEGYEIGDRFSYKGLDSVEDVGRLKNLEDRVKIFADLETRTPSGYRNYLARMADTFNVSYERKEDLPDIMTNYTNAIEKLLEKLKNDGRATQRGSDERVRDVNELIEVEGIDLKTMDLEEFIEEHYEDIVGRGDERTARRRRRRRDFS